MKAVNPVSAAGSTSLPWGVTRAWIITALLCVLVALVSGRYLLGMGPVPDDIAANTLRHPWLLLHIAFAATALLVSPFQLLKGLRARKPMLHRYLGRIYVVGCLAGGVSGFVLALGSSTAPVSSVGFGLLALAWMFTTAAAWYYAVQRQFASHRRWMIRSFALTLAAVTLRLYLPLLTVLPVSFAVGYQAISFLCWIPNVMVAEWWLQRQGRVVV